MSIYEFIFICGVLSLIVDIKYFIRMIITTFHGVFVGERLVPTDFCTIYGMVIPSDADFMLTHMNNARHQREFDFGRMYHAARTGFLTESVIKRGSAMAASTIRYRKPLHMFSLYKITTTCVFWDTKCGYFESHLITLKDGIIRSTCYAKITNTNNLEEILKRKYPQMKKPDMPEDLIKWVEYLAKSSEKMKIVVNKIE